MRVYCPQCGKQFRVQSAEGELSAENHFICTSCQHEFRARFEPSSGVLKIINWDDETFPLANNLPQRELILCPACHGGIEDIDQECPHCLKIPAKILASQAKQNKESESYDPVLNRVKVVWQELLEHFNDPEAHQHFVDVCEKLEHLDFAEERFRSVQNIIGEDIDVERSLRLIEDARLRGLAAGRDLTTVQHHRRSQVRLILYIIGGAMLVLGSLGPSMRFVSFVGVFVIVWLLLDGIKK